MMDDDPFGITEKEAEDMRTASAYPLPDDYHPDAWAIPCVVAVLIALAFLCYFTR